MGSACVGVGGDIVAIGAHGTDLSGDGWQSSCLIKPLHSFLCISRFQMTLAVKEIHIHSCTCSTQTHVYTISRTIAVREVLPL